MGVVWKGVRDMGDVTGQVPPGAGWNREDIAWEKLNLEQHPEDAEIIGDPLENRQRVRTAWLNMEKALDRGEGYIPADERHLYWVQIENDLHRRKRKVATIYCEYQRGTGRRSHWDFPERLFAVFRHKGRYPNPRDIVPETEKLIFWEGELPCEYPQESEQGYSYWEPREGGHPPQIVDIGVRNTRDSYAPGVKPVGVRVEGDVWVFPHGVRMGSDDLVMVLTWFRQRGVQTVGLSQLKFFSECRIG